jgi:hypothetical protein
MGILSLPTELWRIILKFAAGTFCRANNMSSLPPLADSPCSWNSQPDLIQCCLPVTVILVSKFWTVIAEPFLYQHVHVLYERLRTVLCVPGLVYTKQVTVHCAYQDPDLDPIVDLLALCPNLRVLQLDIQDSYKSPRPTPLPKLHHFSLNAVNPQDGLSNWLLCFRELEVLEVNTKSTYASTGNAAIIQSIQLPCLHTLIIHVALNIAAILDTPNLTQLILHVYN